MTLIYPNKNKKKGENVMSNKARFLTVCFCVGTLSSCSTFQSSYTSYSSYQPYTYENTYYQSYDGVIDYGYQTPSKGAVSVPDSYYLGANHSPTPPRDMDRNWVNSQNPQGYTIEIAEGEKASQVAGKLYKTPKNDRTAQIKYHRNDGRSYYKGVYGSYNSYEEAQKALNNLPDDIKQGAGIKNWSNIQTGD